MVHAYAVIRITRTKSHYVDALGAARILKVFAFFWRIYFFLASFHGVGAVRRSLNVMLRMSKRIPHH